MFKKNKKSEVDAQLKADLQHQYINFLKKLSVLRIEQHNLIDQYRHQLINIRMSKQKDV